MLRTPFAGRVVITVVRAHGGHAEGEQRVALVAAVEAPERRHARRQVGGRRLVRRHAAERPRRIEPQDEVVADPLQRLDVAVEHHLPGGRGRRQLLGVGRGRQRERGEERDQSPQRGNAAGTPPSTVIVQPVVARERSETRNATASATSSAVTGRPSRLRFA